MESTYLTLIWISNKAEDELGLEVEGEDKVTGQENPSKTHPWSRSG